jgi:hypothetical protein
MTTEKQNRQSNLKPAAIWQQRLAVALAALAVPAVDEHGVTGASISELPQIMPLRCRLLLGLVNHVARNYSTQNHQQASWDLRITRSRDEEGSG